MLERGYYILLLELQIDHGLKIKKETQKKRTVECRKKENELWARNSIAGGGKSY
jgi:hypothetical protein